MDAVGDEQFGTRRSGSFVVSPDEYGEQLARHKCRESYGSKAKRGNPNFGVTSKLNKINLFKNLWNRYLYLKK